MRTSAFRITAWGILGAAAFALPAWLVAAERTSTEKAKSREVELFSAIDKGDLDVKFVAKSSQEAHVTIRNKTKEPLSIKLPDAFAGVPILAQGGRGGAGGGANGGRGAGQQTVGGGMGGGMGGMGGGGMGGMMNIAPEKVADFKADTVCLEHGKNEPRAAIAYRIAPLDSANKKTGVKELCQLLGSGDVSQRAAQAAAWNLSNGMSWEQLAAKRIEHADGTSEPYFQPDELQHGQQAATQAIAVAKQREAEKKKNSASDSSSSDPSYSGSDASTTTGKK